ncbi:MAG: cyclic nucleotide-binding/CBS domain-containing protein [Natronospirillum sp.]
MQVEQLEIREHLRRFAPFQSMADEVLDRVASAVEVTYFKADTEILAFGTDIHDLYFIRSGAVEIYRRSGELYNRLSEGDIFGQLGLLMNKRVRFPAKALEDTLLYCIPDTVFTELFESDEQFADFVEVEDRSRLRQAVSEHKESNELLTSPIKQLISRELVTLPSTATVREAAERMTSERVSSLVIVTEHMDQPADATMVGIITDRDLRKRVMAQGLPFETPVADIMSTDLVTVRGDQFVFDAMLTMLRYNVHHLPVMHNRRPIGVVGVSDIVQYESQNSLFVVRSIFHRQSVAELQELTKEVQSSFKRMVNEDANSRMIGSAMAGIGRTFTQHLLTLAEAELGPPPVPYCLLGLGSMARDEQLIVTDQDNALILHDDFDPKQHDDYFKRLAAFVSDGLAACGYSYCTGGIMATNKKWRQPLAVWQSYFTHWIERPNLESLLHSSIFFDVDGVAGDTSMANALKELIANKAPQNPRFLAAMAHNALGRTPPLGFFKDFVMEKDGKHNDSIDLKRRGTAPLADLIRVHALACGSQAQNSFQRLEDIVAGGWLTPGIGADLRDAMEFISRVRIRHQKLMLEQGEEPDNYVQPENLSPFERRNLKDAFQILSNAQKFLKFRYHPNRAR